MKRTTLLIDLGPELVIDDLTFGNGRIDSGRYARPIANSNTARINR